MDIINILNTIRENASAEYQARIPEATRTNCEDIRYAMIDSDNIMVANEFMSSLLNKLVKSVVHNKMFNNPLKSLKKGNVPLGDTIEEIYTNFIKGDLMDKEGATLLERKLPDTKTVYHRRNYENQYTVTVDRKTLAKAFKSYDALESYINSTIAKLYDSAELDEFANMKELIASAFKKNALVCVDVDDPLASVESGKNFIKTVKTISGLMAFPSTQHNAYLQAQKTDKKAITTVTRKDEQILILDTATSTSIDVDVLASTFNMTVAEFNDTRKIVIDIFPKIDGKKVVGCLVDEAFFQVYDNFFTISNFFNAKGLYTNYYLTVEQTLAYSILVNAVAFTVTEA